MNVGGDVWLRDALGKGSADKGTRFINQIATASRPIT